MVECELIKDGLIAMNNVIFVFVQKIETLNINKNYHILDKTGLDL